MISFRGHVCASAERIVSAIQRSALYAGIKIETKGVIADRAQRTTTGRCRTTSCWKRQLKPWSVLAILGPDRTAAVIMKERRGLGALVGAGPASDHFPLPIVIPRKLPVLSPPT